MFTVILENYDKKERKVDSGRHSNRVLMFLSRSGKKISLPSMSVLITISYPSH